MDLSLLPVGVDFSHYAVRLSLNLVDDMRQREGGTHSVCKSEAKSEFRCGPVTSRVQSFDGKMEIIMELVAL